MYFLHEHSPPVEYIPLSGTYHSKNFPFPYLSLQNAEHTDKTNYTVIDLLFRCAYLYTNNTVHAFLCNECTYTINLFS